MLHPWVGPATRPGAVTLETRLCIPCEWLDGFLQAPPPPMGPSCMDAPEPEGRRGAGGQGLEGCGQGDEVMEDTSGRMMEEVRRGSEIGGSSGSVSLSRGGLSSEITDGGSGEAEEERSSALMKEGQQESMDTADGSAERMSDSHVAASNVTETPPPNDGTLSPLSTPAAVAMVELEEAYEPETFAVVRGEHYLESFLPPIQPRSETKTGKRKQHRQFQRGGRRGKGRGSWSVGQGHGWGR
ncbi:unnamed protein product, partial [Choristocarpus tenellus]